MLSKLKHPGGATRALVSTSPNVGRPLTAAILTTIFLILGLSSTHVHAKYKTLSNGMPILNSNLGGSGAIFLDFDGGVFRGKKYLPHGGNSSFSLHEREEIYNAWKDISTHFAMFDINVTTIQPNKEKIPTSHVLIAQDYKNAHGKHKGFGLTGTEATAAASSSYAISDPSVISHEIGHNMGAEHAVHLDFNRTLTYRKVDQWGRSPILGDHANAKVVEWVQGTVGDRIEDAKEQDHVATIATEIASEVSNFNSGQYKGDGFRADDNKGRYGTAQSIKINAKKAGGSKILLDGRKKGIIERHNDIDIFKFIWKGGAMKFSAEAERAMGQGPLYASSVQISVKLYDQSLKYWGGFNPNSLGDFETKFSLNLPAGTYYLNISGRKKTADLGVYNLHIEGTSDIVTQLVGSKITLKGKGKFVSSESGLKAMTCNRHAANAPEIFEVVRAGNTEKILLRGNNGKYVNSENGLKEMTCNRGKLADGVLFSVIVTGTNQISLRGNNSKYVSSESGMMPMRCDRNSIGGWEKFTWNTIY